MGTATRICDAFETPPRDGLLDVFDFHELPVGSSQIGPFAVSSARTNHPIECHALRIEAGGRSLTYSGDTGSCADLVELARDTDLFLCEASWEHSDANPPDVHLSGREAGEHASKAGAKRLLLTHLVAWADRGAIHAEARQAYDGDLDIALCDTSYDV